MTRRGLVLGAGGVLGAAWMVGALTAAEEALGWDPREADVLVGTSAGSVLAALLGCGVDVATMAAHQRGEISDFAGLEFDYEVDSGGILPPRPKLGIGSTRLVGRTLVNPRGYPPLAALSAWAPHGRGTLASVRRLVGALAPDGAWAPHPNTWVVAMDYDRGRRVAFGRPGSPPAPLADAVTASCAIPGWFAPVSIDGRRYVDGGACSPTSLDLLAASGLDEVLVLSPMTSFEVDAPSSLAGRLERRFRKTVARRLVREAAKVRRGGARVTLLCPGPEDLQAFGVNLMDHRRRLRVFQTAARTASRALAAGATARVS